MTNAADRARGNTVHAHGKTFDNAGAFAEHTLTAPEVGLAFDAPATIVDEQSYVDAIARATDAAHAYYDTDIETMSDADYDTLLDDIAGYEAANPAAAVTHKLHTAVAGGTSEGGDVAHEIPMLSLDKANTIAEVRAFIAKADAAGSPVRLEPKLDGMAVDVKYENGNIVRVATRGDGRTGEDITERVTAIAPAGMPDSVPFPGTVHVRGELVMSRADFEVSNTARVASGKPSFANPRNAVAGSVRKSNPGYTVAMTFISYGMTGVTDDAATAESAGFKPSSAMIGIPGDPIDILEDFGQERKTDAFPYPTDGIVIKMTDEDVKAELGDTSRAPRWAVAYKYAADRATTKLLGIETGVGRTGAISYTAIVEPVEVDGSVVGRATLHNANFIADNDLRIGDTVEIYKANDIIPRIVRSFPEHRTEDSAPYVPSTVCPISGEPLDMSSVIWRSPAPEASLGALVNYATSRDALDVDGLGEEISDALVERGVVNDLGDLFTLDRDELATLNLGSDRQVGYKVADKILANLDKAKEQPLNRVITALGIRKSGRTFGRRLASHFHTMDAILDAPKEAFLAVEGVGDERMELFYAGFEKNRPVIDKLRAAGVNMGAVPAADNGPKPLAGMKVVVTGAMTGPLAALNRTQVQELIESNGGQASGSVSSSTSLLVCGEEGSSKWTKAKSLGIRIVTPEEFAGMVGV